MFLICCDLQMSDRLIRIKHQQRRPKLKVKSGAIWVDN